jgi:anti-sigma factor RsiW
MNCGDWEERIALYAGGDLPAAEASGVERHVAECAGCQLLLSGLRESLELLRETHAEPVEAAHYAAVRARVLSELERGRRPWWRQAWVYAMVVAAMVVSVAVWPRAPKRIAVVNPPMASPVPPVPSVAQIKLGTVSERPALPRHRRPSPKSAVEVIAVKVEKPAEPLVVKLLTDDPDVIIYWITDTKGE